MPVGRSVVPRLLAAFAALLTAGFAHAARRAEVPPWPNDVSPAGLRAAASHMSNREDILWRLPEATLSEVQRYVAETRSLGLESRSGRITINGAPGPLNVQANNNAGDRVGETQAEIAVAVFGDTVVIGFNDSRGFTVGTSPGVGTLSGFAYSTNGGATFTDGGTTPVALVTDFCFGDPGVDTDERGNWYYNQIYTRTGEQDIGVHHGRFNGAGVLVWDLPVMAAIGTGATGNLDKCLLACDRVTGNVYTSYTRFTATPQIEIARSTTLGATWNAPIVLDAGVIPTASKQAARPFCGPNGEVYVVWEKGANLINCPDGLGNVSNTTGTIGFTRSLPPSFGAAFEPVTIIGTVDHSWTWSGPGDLRERANEFPDIAVDRSGLGKNGYIYVTWHESAPWTSNLSAGPVVAEANDAANNNPTGPELFSVGDDATGTINATADLDYWQFSATQGQSLLMNLDPSTFNCGVTGTAASMRMRLFAVTTPFPNPTGFPDSLLAASALGAFADRIVWTCPRTGNYLIRLQRAGAGTAAPYTYRLRVRNLTFGPPSPARDARDIAVVWSSNQGTVWTAEQLVNDDPAGLENRRPFISVDGLGHAHNFWHDSRKAGLGSTASLTTIYGTTSRDGGLTWNPNFPVTDEPSFFSFNTIAVPNLGDYNISASSGAVTHPAWSDQRISTGDVRTPGTNTYTAGRGPETYSTRVIYDYTIACPPSGNVLAGSVVAFTITNTGTVPDRYDYTLTGTTGWAGAPAAGNTGTIAAGASFVLNVTVPSNCIPSDDTFTLTVRPTGDQDLSRTCTTRLFCQTVLGVDDGSRVTEFALTRVMPNPTRGLTRIDYSVAKQVPVRLTIVDVQGREVAVLAQGMHRPGLYQATWNGRTARGKAAVGMYFARYQANGKVYSRRVAVMQ